MRWGEGDVWAVEFEVVAVGQRLDFAYKYVIRNADGSPALWKPGSDFSFSLAPGAGPGPGGGVAVRDAWDGSARDVRLEMRSGGGEGQHQQQQQRRQLTEQEQELLLYQQTVRRRRGGEGQTGSGTAGQGEQGREGFRLSPARPRTKHPPIQTPTPTQTTLRSTTPRWPRSR